MQWILTGFLQKYREEEQQHTLVFSKGRNGFIPGKLVNLDKTYSVVPVLTTPDGVQIRVDHTVHKMYSYNAFSFEEQKRVILPDLNLIEIGEDHTDHYTHIGFLAKPAKRDVAQHLYFFLKEIWDKLRLGQNRTMNPDDELDIYIMYIDNPPKGTPAYVPLWIATYKCNEFLALRTFI